MDQESIVYGCIKDAVMFADSRQRREANRLAMLSLPSADQWPFLAQEMFSLPSDRGIDAQYQTDVLHFGASYKAVEYEWDEWIRQFERLLSNMYWISAVVHLETELSGTHTFTWEADGDFHIPGQSEITVRCEWSREASIY